MILRGENRLIASRSKSLHWIFEKNNNKIIYIYRWRKGNSPVQRCLHSGSHNNAKLKRTNVLGYLEWNCLGCSNVSFFHSGMFARKGEVFEQFLWIMFRVLRPLFSSLRTLMWCYRTFISLLPESLSIFRGALYEFKRSNDSKKKFVSEARSNSLSL